MGTANTGPAGPEPEVGGGEAAVGSGPRYIFRGDDGYQGGPIGRALGAEADAADIQNFADHVLRKESRLSSRYTSFAEEVRVARRFTSSSDNRFVVKADLATLRDLESAGVLRIWRPPQVYDALKRGPKKLARQAADVRASMVRDGELLVEGQVPAGAILPFG